MGKTKKNAFQAALLILGSILAATAFNAVSPSGLLWLGDWSPGAVAGLYLEDLDEITADRVLVLEREGLLVFLDPQDPVFYSEAPPPGSINVTPRNVPAMIDEIRVLAGAGLKLVILCDGGRCTRGMELARVLESRGFRDFKIFRNGESRSSEKTDGASFPGKENS
ncbi:MAG TPA: hypothetical protein PLR43_02320 [Syntrophales bacterium]|nr:hypothetical protein [Syntrophales bacterium]